MTMVSSWADAGDRGKQDKKIAETTAIAVLVERMTMPLGLEAGVPGRPAGHTAPTAMVYRNSYQTVEALPGR
jgi:hypothetical protein